MKPIPTSVHGVLDYVTGVTLIATPVLLDFAAGAASQVPTLLGVATIIYSALTRYEGGLIRVIPMPGHLFLDVGNGLFLAASPWLFGFSESVWAPHLFAGIFELVVVTLSSATAFRGVLPGAHGWPVHR